MRLAILLCAAAVVAPARDVMFDQANVLRPAFGAEYRVDDHRIELMRGAVLFQLANSGAPPVEIVTPSVTIQPFFTGDYRIEVNRFGETVIVPYGGDLRVVAPSGSQWVTVGQKMIARGPASNPEFRIVSAFTRWSRLVDRVAQALHSGGGGGGAAFASSEDNGNERTGSKPAAGKGEPAARSAAARSGESNAKSSPVSQRGK